MKHLLSSILAFCALAFLFFPSCRNENNKDANAITFDSVSVSRIYHLDGDSTKPSCSVKMKYIFPTKFADDEVLKKIQQEFNFTFFDDEIYEMLVPADAAKQYADNYVDNYKQDAKMQYTNDGEEPVKEYFSYYQTLNNTVIYNKSNILSCQITSMDYKGSFSSSTRYRNMVIDLKTGNVLQEVDIFIPDYKKMLDKILLDKVLKQNKAQKIDDLYDLGFYDIENLTSNNNFLVDNIGITYIFNQSDLAELSVGETRIVLPYSEIAHLLKSATPISELSGQ